MVWVFKTSVNSDYEVKLLTPTLNKYFGVSSWNFDLEDCDNILRLDSSDLTKVIRLIVELSELGIQIKELD